MLNIGGLAVQLRGGESVERAMRLSGMSIFRSADTIPQLTFELDTPQADIECRELHRFKILDGAEECVFGIDSGGVYRYIFSGGGAVSIDPREECIARCTAMDQYSKLRLALWISYGMTAARYGRMPIHASAVVNDGRAVLCLGESGTGKSTHTRLWLKNIESTHLLNDDSPIVSVEEVAAGGCARAYGSPWSGKTACFRQESHPVASLLRLMQRQENSIRRVSKLEAFCALQPSCPPAMGHDERLLDMVTGFVGKVISTTPVYIMGCLPNDEAALMSHKAIMVDNL